MINIKKIKKGHENMKSRRIFEGFIKQEFASDVVALIPEDAHINLNSLHDTIHLSLVVEFKTEEDAKAFRKAIPAYTARI